MQDMRTRQIVRVKVAPGNLEAGRRRRSRPLRDHVSRLGRQAAAPDRQWRRSLVSMLHTREVAGSKPAAPIEEALINRDLSAGAADWRTSGPDRYREPGPRRAGLVAGTARALSRRTASPDARELAGLD
jgi:hypothetical protein